MLLVVALGIILCFVPVLQLVTPADAAIQRMFDLSAMGLSELTPDMDSLALEPVRLSGVWGLMLATILIPVLALVDIFLFRKRVLQARLNIFLACLCIGYYAVLAVFVWFARMNMGVEWHLYAWSGIPLVCFVLTLMATRAILKDEALVRAADRLR